jgi:hypothetical protein
VLCWREFAAGERSLKVAPCLAALKSYSTNTPQFGLIAEEVEKVNPNLVVRNADCQIYTVRYEAVNVMLLNELLMERRNVEKLETALDAVNARLEKQAAQIETTRSTPQMVLNNP